ncbi:MAG: gliding motility-associated C-terminal domain-containing protein, partial [Bacteroidia bacterium]|nr:gliding motility-associated C-terminal domain-containing protein [Bacteroidia bacterium]
KTIFIPNVFSPNSDGKNDVLAIEGNGLTNIYWGIYDRWGNLVFEAYDNTHSWDGTKKGSPVEAGVYSYYLRGTCVKTNGLVTLKGNVSIVK